MSEQETAGAVRVDGAAGSADVKDGSAGSRQAGLVLGAAAIVLGTIIAYLPAMRGDFIWDDDYYVTNNVLLRTWAGLPRIWTDILPSPRDYPLPQYYPLTHTSFWIEYQLWGMNPTGYHLTNVLLHAASALLIWLILKKLAVPGAWVAAAIFAVHPINVESVAWIAERKNVLSGFFFFSSLYVYLRYSGLIPGPHKPHEYLALPREPERVYGLALVLFICALLSKTVTFSLPAVVLLLMWWKRGRIGWKEVLPLIPFFVLGIAAGLLTSWMEQHRVMAVGPDWDHGPLARVLIAGRALWFYVQKLIVPYPLIFNYPRWEIDPGSLLQWLFPIAAVAVIVALVVLRRRLGRGPLTAVLYYAGTLFPALGFVNVFPHRYSFVADHFVYLSSIGLIALAVAGVTRACTKYLSRDAFTGGALPATAAGVLLVFLLLSVMRSRVYAGPVQLWTTTLEQTDYRSWFAANNYGLLLLEQARRDASAGRTQAAQERLAAAEKWFHRVLRLREHHPEARYNLGLIAEHRGEREQAMRWYHESLQQRPNYELPLYRLAVMLQSAGQFDEAERYLRRVIELSPRDINAHLTLGVLLEDRADFDAALEQYEQAADLDPESGAAFRRIGNMLLRQGRAQESLTYFAEAARLEPENETVPNNVGIVFASSGYWEEARIWFERALAINPRMTDALTNLGIVHARQGDPEAARTLFQRALEIDPTFGKARENLAALEEGRLQPATQPTPEPTTEPAGAIPGAAR
jgi:protein O-mannosyl-transferase